MSSISGIKRSRAHGKSIFNESWLSDAQFKKWLKKVPDKNKAMCGLCNTLIDITIMRKSALTSHAKGNKHKLNVKNLNPISSLYFTTNVPKPTSSKNSQLASSSRVDTLISTFAVSHAEIRWVLKILTAHHSYRSCLNLNILFQTMFPDSEIAKSFQLSKTKCTYYVLYGLAPYFREILLQEIKASPAYSILFDESLNHQLQEEQMDVQVRFWNDKAGEVQTRYLESKFFKRPNADKILDELLKATDVLPSEPMVMLSMDGPNTNWKVLDKLKSHRMENELPQIVDVGSCGLHVVHGAFQTGVKATGWNLEKVLKAMWKMFNDSPARRDLYIQLNTSDVFPLMFCQTRWVEDEPVAVRAIQVWQYVVNVIKHFQTLCKSKQPANNKSYDTLVDYHNDVFMKVKFQFFIDIAGMMCSYLKQFQTDNPMMLFVPEILEGVIRRLMNIFIRKAVIDEADTAYSLIKVDLNERENYLPKESVKLPTATKALLLSLNASVTKKLKFKEDCAALVKGIVGKLQERCPLKQLFVRSLSSLIPKNMVENKNCISKFEKVVDKLYTFNQINSKEADNAKLQLEMFISDMVTIHQEEFLNFNYAENRLDHFYGKYLKGCKKYQDLWKVMIMVFCISHGQSQIERGFSINKEVMVENLQNKSLCAQRLVCDVLNSSKKDIHEIEITNKMVTSCKSARSRYVTALEEAKESQKRDANNNKRKLITDEIENVKRKRMEVELCVKSLNKDINVCCDKGETNHDISMFLKANALRKAVTQKESTIADLDHAIQQLEEDLKKK